MRIIKINNKKGVDFSFSSLARILIALIGIIFILWITSQIFRACEDIKNVEDGISCRLLIVGSARLEKASQGALQDQFTSLCPVIEREVPMRDEYPASWGGKISKRTSNEDLRRAIIFDFAELINNAWWITGEGDRAEYLIKTIGKIFVSEFNCYTVYIVKIDPPRDDYPGFRAIPEAELIGELKQITRAEIKGGVIEGDPRSVMEYLIIDGDGAGVFFNKETKTIQLKEPGSDSPALYGIAVGFYDESGINKLAEKIFGKDQVVVNRETSFIYIAPFDEVASVCKVI